MEEDELGLLRRWKAGEQAAGRVLFDRYFRALHRFFRAKVGEAADDLAQATLLRSLEAADSIQRDSSFRAYLFTIARHQLYAWYRRRGRVTSLDPEATTADELTPSPSLVVAHRSERRLLLESLRGVPLDSQVLLELHYWERLSSRELAAVLGVPASTVRSRLGKARQQLHTQLAELAKGTPLADTTDDFEAWADRIQRYAREPEESNGA